MASVPLSTYFEENTPTTEYLKKTLDTEDVVIFTDRPLRSAFILAKDIVGGFEMKFTEIILDKSDNKTEVLELMDRITNKAELPHLFYKNRYVGGGREIVLQYESGELEANLGVEPYMELPKMYPDEEDWARLHDPNRSIYNDDFLYESGVYDTL